MAQSDRVDAYPYTDGRTGPPRRPFDRPYGDTSGSSRGEVLDAYVPEHPAEALARLTPGRNLGWPYCNPDPDVRPGVAGSPQDLTDVPFTRDVQTNPAGAALDCASLPPVEQALGAAVDMLLRQGLGARTLAGEDRAHQIICWYCCQL